MLKLKAIFRSSKGKERIFQMVKLVLLGEKMILLIFLIKS